MRNRVYNRLVAKGQYDIKLKNLGKTSKKEFVADKGMPGVRLALFMAQKMGKKLGQCAVLLIALPG